MTRSLCIAVLAISLAATAPAQIEKGWLQQYSDPAMPNGFESMTACAVAADGSIYAASTAYDSQPAEAATLHKYRPDGTLAWRIQLAPINVSYTQILIDAADDVYFFGRRDPWTTYSEDFVIAKLDSSGALLWMQVLALQAVSNDYGFAVIDASNNFVFAATRLAHEVLFARSYAPGGALNFHTETTQFEFPYIRSAAAMPGGGIVCSGWGFPSHFATAFTATGAHAWSRTGTRNNFDSVASDPSGRIALAGSYWTSQGVAARIEVLDTGGGLLWADQFLVAPWRFSGFRDAKFAPDGSVWAVGAVGSHDESHALAVRYDPTGQRTLVHVGTTDSPGFDGVIVGEAGQAWMQSYENAPPSGPQTDLFQLDSRGGLNWRITLGHDGLWSFPVRAPRSRFIAFGLSRFTPTGSSDALLRQLDARDSPAGHCTAQVNSLGCSPTLVFAGNASISSTAGFSVEVGNLRNRSAAMFLYGVNGSASTPFHGGTLCIAPPLRRSPMLDTGGSMLSVSDCTGFAALDFNAFASGSLGGAPDPALAVAGTVVETHLWSRDPAAPQTTNLSSALRFTMLE